MSEKITEDTLTFLLFDKKQYLSPSNRPAVWQASFRRWKNYSLHKVNINNYIPSYTFAWKNVYFPIITQGFSMEIQTKNKLLSF